MNIKAADKVEQIISMVNSGFNNYQIAEELGINVPAVRYWLKKLNIKGNCKVNSLSDVQKEQVVSLYNEHGNAVLVAQLVGSTQFLVIKYLNSVGIDTSRNFFKGKVADFAIQQYLAGMTQDEIAEYHGCYRQAVQTLFREKGVIGRSQLEQKKITWPANQEIFTDWKNEADLFFYGLLLSDGCISANNSISLALQYSDKQVVEEFKRYSGSRNKLYIVEPGDKKKSGIVSFRFQDSVIANSLRKAGMEERKSSKEKLPTFDLSDINIARHFWRGYICGDGSVRSYPSNGTDRLIPMLHICGSKEICQAFSSFCEKVLGKTVVNSVKKYNDPRRTSELYYFRLNGLNAKIVTLFMFENIDPRYTIKRKSENAMNFKDYVPKINRVKNK